MATCPTATQKLASSRGGRGKASGGLVAGVARRATALHRARPLAVLAFPADPSVGCVQHRALALEGHCPVSPTLLSH